MKKRPNVLMILTDDQGWDDLGCHNNPIIETPHLDSLAAQSVQFSNFYVAPVCAPSRAALLTGRHYMRTGVTHVHGGKDFVHPDETMISDMFKAAGYRTGMWGKWHSGKTTGYFPWERGFEEAYMARLYVHENSLGEFNGERREHTGWTVDTITDYAIDFIERNQNEPWFAFVPHLTVHAPLHAPEDLIAKYEKKGVGRLLAQIYGMIDQMDTSIGRLLTALDRMGLRDDTIVLFMSDNGPQYFPDMPSKDQQVRYVNNYKGHKGSMWENGIKAPLFVSYPDRFKPAVEPYLCDITDVLPTLLDLCEVPLPAGNLPLDGQSMVPALEGNAPDDSERELVIFSNIGWPPEKTDEESRAALAVEYNPVSPEDKTREPYRKQLCGLRETQYKFLQNPGHTPDTPAPVDSKVLVDMVDDPLETTNIISGHAEQAVAMNRKLQTWFETVREEPHAYHVPRFAIGPGTTNVVYLYAPERIHGGVVNHTLSLTQCKETGDGGDYLIDVREKGDYAISLTIFEKTSIQSPIRIRIYIGTKCLEKVIQGSSPISLGSLKLDTTDKNLMLRIMETADTELPGLVSLHFEQMDAKRSV